MIIDDKLSDLEISENDLENSGDVYSGSAIGLQQLFDRLPKLTIKKYNNLIDELLALTGASNIGTTSGKNVQEELNNRPNADIIYTKTETDQQIDNKMVSAGVVSTNMAVIPLTYSKVGTTHNFNGFIPDGLVSAKSIPTTEYSDTDIININGTTYTPTEGSTFVANIPINMLIDTSTKKLTIGGGGGMGKSFDKKTIEAGDIGNGIGSIQQKIIPTGSNFYYATAVIGDYEYQYDGSNMEERNLINDTFKSYSISLPSGINMRSVLEYNNELYGIGYNQSSYAVIYKINIQTLTMTLVATSSFSYPTINVLITKVSNTKYIFSSVKGIVDFDFFDSTFTSLLAISAIGTRNSVVQKDTDNNYLIGLIDSTVANNMGVYKYYISSRSLSARIGYITFPSTSMGNIQSIQTGNKLFYFTDILQGGSNTGELDLANLHLDTTKYDDVPTVIYSTAGALYQNKWQFYTASIKYWLPIIQTSPEQNSLVMKIFKGQKFNTLYDTIHINALPAIGQEAFDITTAQQTATKDLYIYFGMYSLFTAQTICIES